MQTFISTAGVVTWRTKVSLPVVPRNVDSEDNLEILLVEATEVHGDESTSSSRDEARQERRVTSSERVSW